MNPLEINHSSTLRGRADLLRAMLGRTAGQQDDVEQLARQLGFHPRPTPPTELNLQLPDENFPAKEPVEQKNKSQPDSQGYPQQVEDIALWFPVSYRQMGDLSDFSKSLSEDVKYWAWKNPPTTMPRQRDLSPWRTLKPRIRQALVPHVSGRRVDLERLVQRIARLEPIHRLPRQRKRRWNRSLFLIRDESLHLAPYFADQQSVIDRLKRIVPAHDLTVLQGQQPTALFKRLPSAVPEYVSQQPQPGSQILILGDMGLLEKSGQWVKSWRGWLRRQSLRGSQIGCLFPGNPAMVPASLRRWVQVQSWQPNPCALVNDSKQRDAALEQLFELAAPVARLEPGLLRDLRRLVPELADASLESDFWQHDDLASRHFMAATIEPERAKKKWRPRFERLPEALREKVLQCIWNWRFQIIQAPEVWLEEVRNLLPESQRLVPKSDRQDAEAWCHYLEPLLGPHGFRDPSLNDYAQRMLERVTEAAESDPKTGWFIQKLQAVFAGKPSADGEAKTLKLRPAGERLSVEPESTTMEPRDEFHLRLAPITIRMSNDSLRIVQATAKTPQPEISCPDFATSFGVDRYGTWCEFELSSQSGEPVVQRMRWISPGSFLMGSPEDEHGRYDNEHRHRVTLTQGFWLADTACTQEMWQAVADENPSSFKGAQRPVERVSYDDVLSFCQQLNERYSDGQFRLPTEAEWEYACRAGKTSPFSFGETITTEQVNFDGNYPYRSEDPKGVYRKQTVHVKEFACNDWGLYQMHGNVWEWCQDWYGNYPEEDVVDPVGPDIGSGRVRRGGSWISHARVVRSAFRSWSDLGFRFNCLGFRLLSSAGSS